MSENRGFTHLVVGAGSAGCVLAARLTEDPACRVALIEAGGPVIDPDVADPSKWVALQGRPLDWCFETVAQAGTAQRVHAWPRGKVIGGSSCIHAMAHVRGHPSAFDGWGLPGWGHPDLLPYFVKSETSDFAADPSDGPWHGGEGPLRVIQPSDPHDLTRAYMAAGEELGLAPTKEHNGPRITGPTVNSLTLVEGRRQTLADAYLTEDVLARPNLTILTGRLVDRLVFEGARCRGVELVNKGQREAVEADAVILAAGAIGSPAILLRSGIGPSAELRALGIGTRLDLPGVGRNLHDHLLSGGNLYRAKRTLAPSRYQHSESLTYIDGSRAKEAPELVVACVIAPVVTEAFTAPPFGEAYTLMFGFTHPRSRGSLTLASDNPAVAPRIDPAYLADPEDRALYLEALDWARALGAAKALKDWRGEELLPQPEDLGDGDARLTFLGKAAYTHHHPVGTCRMGRDAEAVVDPASLEVRGMEGLLVADASIMPAITTGPVNAAVVAMAERAADLIAGREVLPPMRMTEEAPA